ncbi:hypothetical protein, partial [Microcoleus sp.]|uniref:hypothetical protein n=1 Tax=Microcoleus sp. TaxID=44472 RepID=UPI00403E6035
MWLTKNILDHNKAHPDEKLKFPTAIDLHKLLSCRAFKLYIQGGRDTPQDFDFFLTYNLNAAT